MCTELCKIILTRLNSFLPSYPFYVAQTKNSQQNGKNRNTIHQDHLQNLFSQPSSSLLILKYLSYWRYYVSQALICSQMAFRDVQGHCLSLVTGVSISWHKMCGFHSLIRTLTLQKQLHQVGETLELLLLLLKAPDSSLPIYHFKKRCYGRERAKEQIQGFLLGLWDSLLYWSGCRSADLRATLPPTVADIRSARVAERSMEQLREPAGRGKQQ